MGRRSKVQRTAEEKYQIVMEGLKGGNVAENCRKASTNTASFAPHFLDKLIRQTVAKGICCC